jgi:hypothetical protein
MTVHVELWQLITFGFSVCVAVMGGYWALVQVIVRQFKAHLDERFTTQEEARATAQSGWKRNFDELFKGLRELEKRFNQHLQDLPEKFQRREDAIRQEVGIVNRLDGLAGLVEQRFQNMDEKIEALRRP